MWFHSEGCNSGAGTTHKCLFYWFYVMYGQEKPNAGFVVEFPRDEFGHDVPLIAHHESLFG